MIHRRAHVLITLLLLPSVDHRRDARTPRRAATAGRARAGRERRRPAGRHRDRETNGDRPPARRRLGRARPLPLPALPPGLYEIRAELAGFRPLVRSGVTLTIAQTAVVDLTLTVGGVAEEVTVVGDASPVNTRTRRAQLSRRRARHRRAAAERPQLHRPGAAAAERRGLSASRWRIGGRARPRHERERPGPALERVSPRRHAAQRHDQRAGRQRRRHGARDGDGAGVPRRDQRLQRRVRPHERRPDQRADQGRRQQRARQRLRVPSQRRARREELLRRRRQAGRSRAISSAARSAARSAATGCSSSAATRRCSENLGRTITSTVPDDNARLGCCRIPRTRARC